MGEQQTRKSVPAGTPVVKRIRGCAPCEEKRKAREAEAQRRREQQQGEG